jgi:hypothetical protein
MNQSHESFVRAVLRELTWRRVLIAQPIAFAWLLFRYVNSRYYPPTELPSTFVISGIIIDEITAMALLIAVLCGREAVRRGIATLAAYALPLVVASALVGLTQWYVRSWGGVQVIVDAADSSTIQRKWFNMLYIALDTLIYGAFIMVAYVSRQREKECVEKMRQVELQRAQLESELAQSRLADLEARLDPGHVLDELARIKGLYETESPNAEVSLDALAHDLRAKLDTAQASPKLA